MTPIKTDIDRLADIYPFRLFRFRPDGAKKSDKKPSTNPGPVVGVPCERVNLIKAWLEIAELGCVFVKQMESLANLNSGWARELRPASGRIEAGLGEQYRDLSIPLT